MVKGLMTTVSCVALALATPSALAADAITTAPNAVQTQSPASGSGNTTSNTQTEQQKQEQTAEQRKQVTGEAMAAISETRNALKAMDEGKKDDALAALERATGKLEVILARDPKLALAPTNVSASTIEVVADTDKVKEVRKEVSRLLDDGQVQAARHLLEGLASETVISVSNIPLATYPDAIKQAVKRIDDGKQDEAKTILQTALNTLVITNTIIPLPVVAAQEMLKEAETLSEKSSRTADENKHLNDLLTQARDQLGFAQALGYGTKQDFKDLYTQLDEIKDKTSGGKSGTGFFGKIKSSLSGVVKSSQPVPAANTANAPSTQPNTK